MLVRRLHERHAAVARRSEHGHAVSLEPVTGLVDVVDFEGEVSEKATDRVGVLLVPVVRELDLGVVARRPTRQKDEREPAALAFAATGFAKAELLDEKLERGIEVTDAQHVRR